MQQEYRNNQSIYTNKFMRQVHVVTVLITRVTVTQVYEIHV